MNTLQNYYNNIYTEDDRLFKDQKHKTEFILTTDYIDKYLKKGMKILELGAGTGVYSLLYASKGHEVDALEYIKENLDILKSKITEDMNINPVLGDARNLSMYEDETFDMVLNLGPLYHLEGGDRDKVIQEAKRVCKKGGLIYSAYISNNLTFVKRVKKFDDYVVKYKEEILEGFRIGDNENVFTLMYPSEMEELMKRNGLSKVHHLTTDGISDLIKERIDSLPEDQYEVWIDYLRTTAEREDQLGYGEHLLYIAKK
ncbi:MAG TPA: class I SAM-dependent methyltransferase [Candidatus Dojkabacteria bacterium]|nr:class I SAM-dependent methyltransferase [Candidatus Dojkabacteria bacterium]